MKICPKCNVTHEKNGKFCCRSCANSRTWNEEDKKRKSISVKKFIENNGHPGLGKSGWKHTDELKEIKRKLSLKLWDKIGRKTTEHFRIQNIINVSAYRARKHNATHSDLDANLIKIIYENCPDGYHVDHIIALASGGKHHQDNLQYLPMRENCRKGKTQNYNKSLALDWRNFS